MSDAAKLAPEMRQAAMRDISADGLPSAIERQAAAGEGRTVVEQDSGGRGKEIKTVSTRKGIQMPDQFRSLKVPDVLAGVLEADSLVLLVDGQDGFQAGDREILSWLRQKHPSKKVILAVNK